MTSEHRRSCRPLVVGGVLLVSVVLAGCGSSGPAASPRSSTAPSSVVTAPVSSPSTTTLGPTSLGPTTDAPGTAPVGTGSTGEASNGPVAYRQASPGISSDHTITPTAIVLHWWGYDGGDDIQALVNGLEGQIGYYDQDITKAEYDANVASGQHGHTLGVQVGILDDGTVYRLTPSLDSYAAHAACANSWSIGIEIEGAGPDDLRAHPDQLRAVEDTVADLMVQYDIPLDGPLAADGRSGTGVHSHKEVDANCQFADGSYAGQGKDDVDDDYLATVKDALRQRGLG